MKVKAGVRAGASSTMPNPSQFYSDCLTQCNLSGVVDPIACPFYCFYYTYLEPNY